MSQGAAPVYPVKIVCEDGALLHGQFFPGRSPRGIVVIAPATGVAARYYHRFAAFLGEHRFSALTFDYRGIATSRGAVPPGQRISWRDWGELDIEAALVWSAAKEEGVPLYAVGHSIGGAMIGAAPAAKRLARVLTVGAQFAYWRDYAKHRRLTTLLKWNVVMPALAIACGHFPGKRLGWLEDLPQGVALDWAFHRATLESGFPKARRQEVLRRYAQVTAPVVAVHAADDEFTSVAGLQRVLNYYSGADRQLVTVAPGYGGQSRLGHFGLFHDRNRDGFWQAALAWLSGRAWEPAPFLEVRSWPPHQRPTERVS